MSTLTPKIRPADKVRNYLLQEFGNSSDETIKRLPTMRQLVDHLHVSLPTVQSAYRSLVTEGHIITRTGIGSFFNPKPAFSSNKPLRIAINVLPSGGTDYSHYWFDGIYAGLLHAVLEKSLRMEFLALPHREEGNERIFSEKIRHGGCDGLLMLSPANCEKLAITAKEHNIPIIYLFVPGFQATTNFVAPGYLKFARLAGQAFAAANRNRVLFLSNGTFDAPSDTGVFSGLALGLGARLYQETDLRFLDVHEDPDWNVNELEKYIRKFNWIPDAIFCAGDYLVSGVVKIMESMGLRVPEDASVIGASGINPTNVTRPGFTHVLHPFQNFGVSLTQLICQRIELKGADIPGIYMGFQYSGGTTTNVAENRVLGI